MPDQWTRIVTGVNNGPLGTPAFTATGADTNRLAIAPLPQFIDTWRGNTANLRCIVSNTCGSLASAVASLTVCGSEFNCDGVINPDDLGDFITCYFTNPPCSGADFNSDGNINADDLGDFITTYFNGC